MYFWLINNTTALETVHEKIMQNYAEGAKRLDHRIIGFYSEQVCVSI